jgi:hypothetical protein
MIFFADAICWLFALFAASRRRRQPPRGDMPAMRGAM